MASWRGSNAPPRSTFPRPRSITAPGGRSPRGPSTAGAGSGAPCEPMAVAVASISVRVSPPDVPPPGRNSLTLPSTRTESPTRALGAVRVKTKTPSDVAWLRSGCGSCIQKPLTVSAVTTPGTPDTARPFSGEMCAAPWMSRMRGEGAAACAAGAASSGAASAAAARSAPRPCTTYAP
ncbi:hypothetical protein LUX57_42030 [Actinomadura madurae]|uniref:hypothetical protein n=1 Tax=Actinomadura madurae TaxID=1993 RepID=UPI0020D26035|nr:hypothetical protein [Actinomadura madurae]MCP9970933.1 hypothetical protein [Actinomadura madurae]